MWQWKTNSPRMIGSRKSISITTEPGTLCFSPDCRRTMRNDDAVGPMRMRELHAVDALHQEVNLVDVKVVDLVRDVDDVPLLDRAGVDDEHRRRVHREALAVDEEMRLGILAEDHEPFCRRRRQRGVVDVGRQRRADGQRPRREVAAVLAMLRRHQMREPDDRDPRRRSARCCSRACGSWHGRCRCRSRRTRRVRPAE